MASEDDTADNVVNRVAQTLSVDGDVAKSLVGTVAAAIVKETDGIDHANASTIANLVVDLRGFEAEPSPAPTASPPPFAEGPGDAWESHDKDAAPDFGGGIEFSTHGSGGGQDD